jgi:hypothetical protein
MSAESSDDPVNFNRASAVRIGAAVRRVENDLPTNRVGDRQPYRKPFPPQLVRMKVTNIDNIQTGQYCIAQRIVGTTDGSSISVADATLDGDDVYIRVVQGHPVGGEIFAMKVANGAGGQGFNADTDAFEDLLWLEILTIAPAFTAHQVVQVADDTGKLMVDSVELE